MFGLEESPRATRKRLVPMNSSDWVRAVVGLGALGVLVSLAFLFVVGLGWLGYLFIAWLAS